MKFITKLLPVLLFSVFIFSSFDSSANTKPPWRRYAYRVKVKFTSVPVGASVYIEDKKWGIAGTTPTNWIKLPRSRTYKVWLTHPDYEDFETTITLTRKYKNYFNFNMKKKIKMGTFEFKDSGTGSSTGAKVFIDGVEKGSIPVSVKLLPGKYAVKITREGYKEYTELRTLEENSIQAIMVNLIKIQKPKGKILITSDVDNAEIEVDKISRGFTPQLVTVPAGSHLIVVKHKDNKVSQIVDVKSGSTKKVFAKLKKEESQAPHGYVTVITNISDTEVIIDGEPKGKTPLKRLKLLLGQHLVEVRKKGYISQKRTITIKASEQILENFDLSEAPRIVAMGSLKITSETGAQIFIDGQPKGKSSVFFDKIKIGNYQIEVVKPGYKRVQRTVSVKKDKTETVHIRLERVGNIKITANVIGAVIIIDNQEIGKVPLLNHELPVGTYRLEIRAKGYRTYTDTIAIKGGTTEPLTFNVNLLPLGPTPDEIAEMKSSLSAFGAKTIPPKSFTATAGLDWPYYMDGRLTVGIWKLGNYGIDGGATFRSYFNMHEFLFNVRGQLFKGGPLTAGVFMNIGGGIGSQERTNFTFNLGGSGTLSFREKVNLTLGAYLNVYRDRFCLSNPPGDGDPRSEPAFCVHGDEATNPEYQAFLDRQIQGWEGHSLREPYWGSRIMMFVSVEWALNSKYSVYAKFSLASVPLSPSNTIYRPAYMKFYNEALMPSEDPRFYGGAGFLWKF
ncbi:MAG: PEGA domain-containing protein [Deltaproteobacteria bacterium]|nr:PEGA domain-containing protein [Deltaproteobacteria bacterium]